VIKPATDYNRRTMRWLVTGGAGFIGAHFLQLLTRERPDVALVNVDALTYAAPPSRLAALEQGPTCRFVRGDICDAGHMRELLRGVHSVIHFAAESHVDRSVLGAEPFVRSNVLGTQVLLEAARAAGVARFVLVSTDEVYGSLPPGRRSLETDALAPNSPYAASKAAAELLVRAAVQTFGFPALVTRGSNTYGPRQHPEKLIPLTIRAALSHEPIPLYGNGQQVRNWLAVEDHCRGILAVLELGRPGETYNLGSAAELTNEELVRLILEQLGKPETLIRYVADRPGHDLRYALDSSKAQADLGWQPLTLLAEGLEHTIDWYRDNAAWLQQVGTGEFARYYQQQYEGRLAGPQS